MHIVLTHAHARFVHFLRFLYVMLTSLERRVQSRDDFNKRVGGIRLLRRPDRSPTVWACGVFREPWDQTGAAIHWKIFKQVRPPHILSLPVPGRTEATYRVDSRELLPAEEAKGRNQSTFADNGVWVYQVKLPDIVVPSRYLKCSQTNQCYTVQRARVG